MTQGVLLVGSDAGLVSAFKPESKRNGIVQERITGIRNTREHPAIPMFFHKAVKTRDSAFSERWTCPTCNNAVSSAYCPACGECPLHARDLTLGGLFNQVAQACTNLDAPL